MTASLLRLAIGRPASLSRASKLSSTSMSSSKLMMGSRRAYFQSATPATISTTATTAIDNESTLRGMTLATLAATGLTLYGLNVQKKEKKADCTAICAVVGKDQFDAR